MRGKEDMERLTCKLANNVYDTFDPIDIVNNEYSKVNYERLLLKLGEYEDLEGQGRLLKLPYNAVYYIVDKNNPKYAAVMSKTIRDLTIYEIEKINVDGRYFSTKELVEAKLKN